MRRWTGGEDESGYNQRRVSQTSFFVDGLVAFLLPGLSLLGFPNVFRHPMQLGVRIGLQFLQSLRRVFLDRFVGAHRAS